MTKKKWVKVTDLSRGQYFASKNIRFKTSMLSSCLCHYSDAYIVLKGKITVRTTGNSDISQKDIAIKNAPFSSSITKKLYIDRYCRRSWYSNADV